MSLSLFICTRIPPHLAQLAGGIEAWFDHVRTNHQGVLNMINRVQDYIEFVGEWMKRAMYRIQQRLGRRGNGLQPRPRRSLALTKIWLWTMVTRKHQSRRKCRHKPTTQKAAPSTLTSISSSKPSSPRVKTVFDSMNCNFNPT